jgi:hypothetical protein
MWFWGGVFGVGGSRRVWPCHILAGIGLLKALAEGSWASREEQPYAPLLY